MKTLLSKAWVLALLVAVALIPAACGSAGGTQQGDESGGGGHGQMDHGSMDHGQMDRGSMGMGSKDMARQMVLQNGEYSDERFIDAMVPHHQGAIEMAEVALDNAEHEKIKDLSRNIVSTQQAEIEELKTIRKEEFGTSRVPMEMSKEQMRSMGMKMNPRHLAHSKPFDEAFIDAMIPHHQSAVYMAQLAREKSKIPEVKDLAENIVSAQKREIEQMKQWRREWYQEG